jgi:WD40 repeat protein
MRSKKTVGSLVLLICLALSLSVWAQNERARVVVAQPNAASANPVTLRLKATLGIHRHQLETIDFSPDGQFLVTGSEQDKTKLWNIASGRLIAELDGSINPRHIGYEQSRTVFSPDSQLLLTTRGKDVSLWDATTGQLKFTLTGHEDNITAVSFSPGGERLATGSSDGTIRLWNVTTGQFIKSLTVWRVKNLPKYRIISRALSWPVIINLSFSPDGHQVLTTANTGATDSPAKLWDAETGKLLASLGGHTRQVGTMTESAAVDQAMFSPDGNFILTLGSDEAKLWDARSGGLKATLENLGGGISFSPDGRFLGLIKYKSRTGILSMKSLSVRAELGVDTVFLNQLAFSPDSQTLVFASGYKKYQAKLIDVSGGDIKATIPLISKFGNDIVSPDYQKDVDLLAFHPNSRWLMGSNHNSVRFWDAETGHLVTETMEGRDPAAISPGGHLLVTAGKDKKSVLVWEMVGV